MPDLRRLPLRACQLGLVALLGTGCAQGSGGGAEAPEPLYLWAQMHPDRMVQAPAPMEGEAGGLLARAILPPGSSCPEILVDGEARPMRPRVPMVRADFPPTVCEAVYPGEARAEVAGRPLPRRPERLERVLVIGDTGCRLTDWQRQMCNDRQAWPFATLADRLAGLEVDLVIHVGDYHYRERGCPDAIDGCRDSAWGYLWAAWEADFFAPGAPLLPGTPWLMLRGNHENCARAGAGWLHLLGPTLQASVPENCRDDTAPYWLRIGDHDLLVLDTANAGSAYGAAERAKTYGGWMTAAFAAGAEDAPDATAWLLLHQPAWQWPHHGATPVDGRLLAGTRAATLNAVSRSLADHARSGAPPRFAQVLSGDTHVFEVLAPPKGGPLPWQLVYGNGGTYLDPPKAFADVAAGHIDRALTVGANSVQSPFAAMPGPPLDKMADPPFEARASFFFDFGYTVLDRGPDGDWTATAYDLDGEVRMICDLDRWRAGDPALETPCRQP